MGFCKTCIHTEVCQRDKNIIGENIYVAPHPLFFDDEYKKKSWENYLKREEQGFPCDEFLEITRCKDCKYMTEHYDTDGNVPYWTCSEWDSGTDYDGYCHYGERRENDKSIRT